MSASGWIHSRQARRFQVRIEPSNVSTEAPRVQHCCVSRVIVRLSHPALAFVALKLPELHPEVRRDRVGLSKVVRLHTLCPQHGCRVCAGNGPFAVKPLKLRGFLGCPCGLGHVSSFAKLFLTRSKARCVQYFQCGDGRHISSHGTGQRLRARFCRRSADLWDGTEMNGLQKNLARWKQRGRGSHPLQLSNKLSNSTRMRLRVAQPEVKKGVSEGAQAIVHNRGTWLFCLILH